MPSNEASRPSVDQWVRWGGVAGIVFVVLSLVGGVVQGNVPVYTDDPADIRGWFADNSSRYLAGWFLIAIGIAVFYPAFLAALTSLLVRAEGGVHPWALLALIAGLLVPVPAMAASAFDGTLALLEGDFSDELARTLSAADYYAFTPLPLIAGIFTGATSAVILRTGVLWRPLAGLGLLVTAGGIVAGAVPLEKDPDGVLYVIGYLTLFAFFLWTIGVSVFTLRISSFSDEGRR